MYEGEVTELTPEYTESQGGQYGKVGSTWGSVCSRSSGVH